MKIIYREFGHDYSTYSFGYATHAELEPFEDPALAYTAGFLPASSDPAVRNRFYMARSVRVPVKDFSPSSENRRVFKKFDGTFSMEFMSRDELATDESFHGAFLDYFAKRHGENIMSKERLYGILQTPLPLRGRRYRKNGVPAGYALEVARENWIHYWYPFYDLSYAGTGFGMWLMLDALRHAKTENRAYVYLGTAYGAKGKYKTNIEQLEWWDGNGWSTDRELLKKCIASDAKH